jgi:dethiobiotin synthetase
MPPGLFITGTDTGVGKTYVASMIVRSLVSQGHRVGVYKPVASGCRREGKGNRPVSDDAMALWNAAGQPASLDHVCPQRFEMPLAPHLAAKAEGKSVDLAYLSQGLEYWKPRSDVIVVEGVGGLMTPLDDKTYVADLAKSFGFPLVVVSRNVLGTINHTFQTVIVASTYRGGLPIAGIVLNHAAPPSNEDPSLPLNRRELARHCNTPVLDEIGWGKEHFDGAIDWFSLGSLNERVRRNP